jgi:hypothetical protein
MYRTYFSGLFIYFAICWIWIWIPNADRIRERQICELHADPVTDQRHWPFELHRYRKKESINYFLYFTLMYRTFLIYLSIFAILTTAGSGSEFPMQSGPGPGEANFRASCGSGYGSETLPWPYELHRYRKNRAFHESSELAISNTTSERARIIRISIWENESIVLRADLAYSYQERIKRL